MPTPACRRTCWLESAGPTTFASSGSQIYKPPPAYACAEDMFPVDLGYDPDLDEAYLLIVRILTYKGLAVWYSLQQTVQNANGNHHTVGRIDCCDGTIHRHVMKEGQGEIDRVTLVDIPVHGQTVVDGEYQRYYDDMVDNWEERLRRWRSS